MGSETGLHADVGTQPLFGLNHTYFNRDTPRPLGGSVLGAGPWGLLGPPGAFPFSPPAPSCSSSLPGSLAPARLVTVPIPNGNG